MMKNEIPCEIKMLAYAKLNLTLDIVGVRDDGYHLMDMVMRSIDLADEVNMRATRSGGITFASNLKYLPRDDRNLAVKAVRELCSACELEEPNLRIYINKKIPSQAGMGGGSADAAAALIGANLMLGTGLDTADLCRIGERVGSDVPFCIVGGAARVGGIGEVISPIEDNCDYAVVVLMPSRGKSTREAFARFDSGAEFRRPDTDAMLSSLAAGDSSAVGVHLCNVFAEADSNGGSTAHFKSLLLSTGALGACMTGSGAAVFGIYSDRLSAKKAADALRGRVHGIYVASPTDRGVRILFAR